MLIIIFEGNGNIVKKGLSLLVALLLSMSLSACGNTGVKNEDQGISENSSTQTESITDKEYTESSESDDNVDVDITASETSLPQTNTDSVSKTEETQASGNNGTVPGESKPEEITIESLVASYNSVAKNHLEYFEDFEIQNRESSHYRVEYRLSAYETAVGKSYKMSGQIVDILMVPDNWANKMDYRLYTDGATIDQCFELIKGFSPLFDPSISETTINETLEYLNETKDTSGYHYGELSLYFFQNYTKGGYDLMVSTY